jgi:hypothetical protein
VIKGASRGRGSFGGRPGIGMTFVEMDTLAFGSAARPVRAVLVR